MKAKALKFGKAMSAGLFVLLLVVVGMKNALAQNLVATLQHGDNISMFYGSNAFVQAHDAAQTGDIITLSSGTFNPTTITKAITLRGAGCCMDSVTGIYPTVFSNSLAANVPDNEHSLTMEGICFNSGFRFGILNNPRFIKCNFSSLYKDYNNDNPLMQNAQFVDCFIAYISGFTWGSEVLATNTQFTNCYVEIGADLCTLETRVSFANSIVLVSGSMGDIMAVNSIFYCWRDGYGIPDQLSPASSSCVFYNCVAINPSPSTYDSNSFFQNQTNTTNLEVEHFTDVFETLDYFYFSELINERFILKSSFATSFLGNDGTEVGIHGGQAPYNPRPNYMVLKQCNVANQSTVDGKLSVEIQVVSEGE